MWENGRQPRLCGALEHSQPRSPGTHSVQGFGLWVMPWAFDQEEHPKTRGPKEKCCYVQDTLMKFGENEIRSCLDKQNLYFRLWSWGFHISLVGTQTVREPIAQFLPLSFIHFKSPYKLYS